MKDLLKITASCFFVLCISINVYGVAKASVGTGLWSDPNNWVPVGVPGSADDVTIGVGHVITNNVTSNCQNLTVNGTLSCASPMLLKIYRGYTVSATGSEIGNSGVIQFWYGVPSAITAVAPAQLTSKVSYIFYQNMTIAAGTVMTKTVTTTLWFGAVVTNLGTVTLATVSPNGGCGWVNAAGSSLTLTTSNFLSTAGTLTADAVPNTVHYNITSTGGNIKQPTAGYYNLTLSGAASKNVATNLTVLNHITINVGCPLISNNNTISVGGDWLLSGSFTQGTGTVDFAGAGAQSIGGTVNTTFYNLTKSGTGTTTLARNTVVTNLLNISSGILSTSTFSLTGAAGLTQTNGELQLAKLGVTLPELSGAYAISGGKVTFNGAGAQTVRSSTYNNVDILGSGTKTAGGALDINGALTISSTFTVSGLNYAINIAGDFINNGTFLRQTGTVTFDGVTTVSGLSTTAFHNITITGTLTGHVANMRIAGNFVNNGTFNNNGGTLTFMGSIPQTISGTSSTTFENLAVSNTAGVSITSGSYVLDGGLTLSNGTFATGGNTFRMTSTIGKTAYIAQITGTGAITGNFIVESRLRGGAASWADMASPVQTTTFGEWASSLPAISYSYSPTFPYDYPTQWTFDNATDDFVAVTAAATPLTSGVGFEVYLAGDYNYGAFAGATVTTTGVPTQGDQAIAVGAGDNLVGNPFACSISWAAVSAASPGISGFDIMDAGNYVAGGAEIPSGQGFWVYGAGTLNIPESAKTSTATDNVRSAVIDPYFTLKLSSTEYNVPFTHILKVAATADASDGWNSDEDHLYRKTPVKEAPSLYTPIDDKKLIINQFNNSNETYSMPVVLKIGVAGTYKFEAININRMTDNYQYIKLEDKLLNKMIDLNKQNEYSFVVNVVGDDVGRFVLHFSKNKDIETPTNVDVVSDFANHVEILPTLQGNIINFYLNEAVSTTITVTNLIGQAITNAIVVNASNQSVAVQLPEGYAGMYILNIQSAKGNITKKFVKN